MQDLDTVLACLGDAAFLADGRGTITYANEAAWTLVRSEDLVGRPISEILGPGFAGPHLSSLLAQAPLTDYETPVQRQGAEAITATCSVARLPDGSSMIIARDNRALRHVVSDLGRSRRTISTLDRALRRTSQALQERDQRLERLDEMERAFLTLVAHELRTPLSIVQGAVDALAAGSDDETERNEMTACALEGAQRLAAIVNGITDAVRAFSGLDPLRVEGIALAELTDEALAAHLETAHKKGLTLVNTVPLVAQVHADRDRIRQVLLNLLDNAVRLTEQGSVTVGARPAPDEVEIWVADTGPGIARERAASVFGRFQVATDIDAHHRGLGLGLPLARAIVEHHGGRMWFESNGTGHGTTFRFTLPAGAPTA